MNPYWSWLLTGVGVTGLYIAGRKNWAGWAIGLGAQVLWIAYAVATRQWGFLASAALYGGVYVRNIMRWRGEKKQTPARVIFNPNVTITDEEFEKFKAAYEKSKQDKV